MLVIKLKDIVKYLASAILIISILVLCTRYFFSNNKGNLEERKPITKVALVNCMENIIPNLTKINEDEKVDKKEKSLAKKILNMELGYIKMVKQDTQIETSINSKNLEDAKTGLGTEIIDSGIEQKYTDTYGTVQVRNSSKYPLTQEILTPNFELKNKKDVIIYHTHTCESYTSSEKFSYVPTGTYRTTDLNFTVARVGTELTDYLNKYGYNVIHDQTFHDYPAYSGSYDRSLNTVNSILSNNQGAEMIIDLHRDAVGSNNNYAPKVKIGDEYAAQLMFVIGTDGGGLEHPNWQNNLKFAVKIQEKANEMYPGLFKPIIIRNSRYNQNVSNAATIIEVGATGNTMEECLTSMKYLSKVISETIK